MKIGTLLIILALSSQSQAFVTDLSVPMCERTDSDDAAVQCTLYTTFSLPTLIVDDTSGEEVWNIQDENLMAQYKSELAGTSNIYAIKRYADIKTGGDIDAAIVEIKRNLQLLNK